MSDPQYAHDLAEWLYKYRPPKNEIFDAVRNFELIRSAQAVLKWRKEMNRGHDTRDRVVEALEELVKDPFSVISAQDIQRIQWCINELTAKSQV